MMSDFPGNQTNNPPASNGRTTRMEQKMEV
jgi:hypothetical protein